MNLKVPKKKAPLTLHFVGGSKVSGSVFLSHQSRTRRGAERTLDLLNSDDMFFPFESEDTTAIRLVHKRNIVLITAHEDGEEGEPIGKRVNISMVLTDGERVVGDLIIAQPEHKSRVLDFFNDNKGQFFSLVSKDKRYYINVRHVEQVSSE